MDDQSKLRKYENLLAISGAGVIAFGLWSVVKAVAFLFVLSPKTALSMGANDLAEMGVTGVSQNVAGIIEISIIILLLLVDLLVRFYVGRSAIIDGRRQKKKSIAYVIMAVLLAMGLIFSTIARFTSAQPEEASTLSSVINSADTSIFIDLTSLLAFIEMIVAAIMVRRLREKLGTDRTEVM